MDQIPESWATATVHMFLTRLRHVLSDHIDELVLSRYGEHLPSHAKPDSQSWDDLLDSDVVLAGSEHHTVKNLIQSEIEQEAKKMSRETARYHRIAKVRSALLFGPPGTSKTTLVRALARKLGWPCIEITPNEFLKGGLEAIYTRSDEVFEDLMDLSCVVILFDEVDALMHEREPGELLDVTREFLTTSMLPKIAQLHRRGRAVFFMVTNHRRVFDAAIVRPGRFDLLVCVGPPSWKTKLAALDRVLGVDMPNDIAQAQRHLQAWIAPADRARIDLFTVDETRAWLRSIGKGAAVGEALGRIGRVAVVRRIKEWSRELITLRESEDELSPYGEYKKDRTKSRRQY